ncbi:MAG: helix-turn-helix domain-containing protein [Desulfovibrionaceae bacterium]|nr:helix-turn-helix domain-containing protein [Desulfovibrionaceae bacterium]
MTIKPRSDTSLIKRLSDILDSYHLEKKELALVGGVRPGTITNYFQGKTVPDQDVLAKWANEWNLNLNWLVLGEGKMNRSENATLVQADRLATLEQEVSALKEWLADKNKIIALHEKLAGFPQP